MTLLAPSKWLLPAATLAALLAGGCGSTPPPATKAKAPEVLVSTPLTDVVTDHEEFTGRTEAKQSVEIRARVTGYLDQILFKEGVRVEVKKGDVLFIIDPRPYEADLAKAEANVVQARAALTRLEDDYVRAADLLPRKAISREAYDKIVGDRAEAGAAVKVAEAARDFALLNLSFTKVRAPFTGHVSRALIDPGNLVKADETVLTTIVSVAPIYVYFDVDERTVMRLRRLRQEGVIKSAAEVKIEVRLGFTDEPGFPHTGWIDFVENKVDPGSGTLRIRAVFDNPKRMISPGQFSRIRLPVGGPRTAMLVPEQALGIDQGQRFVYVVGSDDKVSYRKVQIGSLHEGRRVIDPPKYRDRVDDKTGKVIGREIESGLLEGERIVVSGLQRVRPGEKVTPKSAPMPAGAASARPPADVRVSPEPVKK